MSLLRTLLSSSFKVSRIRNDRFMSTTSLINNSQGFATPAESDIEDFFDSGKNEVDTTQRDGSDTYSREERPRRRFRTGFVMKGIEIF